VTEPFSKWGDTSAGQTTVEKFCGMNWQLWRHKHWNMTSLHNTYTPYEGLKSKLHYFRQNYTTIKRIGEPPEIQIDWYRCDSMSSASLALIIRFILTDWIKPFDACVTEIFICFHSGWYYPCPVKLCYVTINERNSYDNFSIVE